MVVHFTFTHCLFGTWTGLDCFCLTTHLCTPPFHHFCLHGGAAGRRPQTSFPVYHHAHVMPAAILPTLPSPCRYKRTLALADRQCAWQNKTGSSSWQQKVWRQQQQQQPACFLTQTFCALLHGITTWNGSSLFACTPLCLPYIA